MLTRGERELNITYHVLAPGHEALVDNLGGVVSPSINMDALLHDRI